jgi:hypothetical protein
VTKTIQKNHQVGKSEKSEKSENAEMQKMQKQLKSPHFNFKLFISASITPARRAALIDMAEYVRTNEDVQALHSTCSARTIVLTQLRALLSTDVCVQI